jgi:predicted ATP-binding protein involved in virulence
MQVTSLRLTQVRGYVEADFQFQPGMNLLVGINGVGKSTVLDALRIMLVQALPRLTGIRMRPKVFEVSDITNGRSALTAELRFEIAHQPLNYLVHQPLEQYRTTDKEGAVREQAYNQDERRNLTYIAQEELPHIAHSTTKVETQRAINSSKDIPKKIKSARGHPLAIYFSTRRSLISDAKGSQSERSQGLAHAEALRTRELRIREFVDWWLVQEELGTSERIDTLKQAILSFLDDFTDVQVVRDPESTLKLYKRDTALTARQLSDGERGILSLVLDLARRLALANPKLQDPLRKGKAVVLIDELDLHLHPRWQRTIVQKLTETFPACQFIATTHSPQIIGEVPPESIIMLEHGKQPYRPDQSLGMDSNWILEVLMDTSPKNVDVGQELERIAALIEDEQYDEATTALDALTDLQRGFSPQIVRLQTRIDRIRLLGE